MRLVLGRINKAMSDDREESVTEGQKSIYFDATEGSQLLPGRPLDSAAFPDIEASPWTISPPPVLPAPMGGLRSMGGAGGGMATSPLPHSEAETTTLRDDESLTASTLDDSYMGHVRAQATLPKKWLSEVDIEPYMRGTGGRGGKKSIFAGRGLALRDPLLEELLPSSRKAALFPALQGPVPRRDWIFATAYWIALAIMMVLGLALCLVHPVEMKDRVIRSGSMFRALVDSVWILFAAVVLGSLLSTLWVVTLRKFPTHVVHGMVYAAPMAAFVVGLTAAYEYLRGGGGGWWLFLTAIAGLVLSGALATWSLTNRHHIANTVAVVKMSAEVLAANPSIYLASLALLVGYVVFVALWIVFYAHALMLGHVSTLPDAAAKVWRLSGWSYYLQAYMILMLVWTSTICAGLQKCMIGGVVGKWYFFRTQVAEAVIPSPSSHSWDALRASLTTHFGQICLASLVLTGVRISRGFFQAYRYVAPRCITLTLAYRSFQSWEAIALLLPCCEEPPCSSASWNDCWSICRTCPFTLWPSLGRASGPLVGPCSRSSVGTCCWASLPTRLPS